MRSGRAATLDLRHSEQIAWTSWGKVVETKSRCNPRIVHHHRKRNPHLIDFASSPPSANTDTRQPEPGSTVAPICACRVVFWESPVGALQRDLLTLLRLACPHQQMYELDSCSLHPPNNNVSLLDCPCRRAVNHLTLSVPVTHDRTLTSTSI